MLASGSGGSKRSHQQPAAAGLPSSVLEPHHISHSVVGGGSGASSSCHHPSLAERLTLPPRPRTQQAAAAAAAAAAAPLPTPVRSRTPAQIWGEHRKTRERRALLEELRLTDTELRCYQEFVELPEPERQKRRLADRRTRDGGSEWAVLAALPTLAETGPAAAAARQQKQAEPEAAAAAAVQPPPRQLSDTPPSAHVSERVAWLRAKHLPAAAATPAPQRARYVAAVRRVLAREAARVLEEMNARRLRASKALHPAAGSVSALWAASDGVLETAEAVLATGAAEAGRREAALSEELRAMRFNYMAAVEKLEEEVKRGLREREASRLEKRSLQEEQRAMMQTFEVERRQLEDEKGALRRALQQAETQAQRLADREEHGVQKARDAEGRHDRAMELLRGLARLSDGCDDAEAAAAVRGGAVPVGVVGGDGGGGGEPHETAMFELGFSVAEIQGFAQLGERVRWAARRIAAGDCGGFGGRGAVAAAAATAESAASTKDQEVQTDVGGGGGGGHGGAAGGGGGGGGGSGKGVRQTRAGRMKKDVGVAQNVARAREVFRTSSVKNLNLAVVEAGGGGGGSGAASPMSERSADGRRARQSSRGSGLSPGR